MTNTFIIKIIEMLHVYPMFCYPSIRFQVLDFKYGQGIGTLFRSVKFSMLLKINKRSVTRS